MPIPSTRGLATSRLHIAKSCPVLFMLALPCLLASFGTPSPGTAAENQASVLVEVRQVRDARGHVLVALCTQPTFLTASCPYYAAAPAAAGTVAVRIDGVPPGSYSAEALHDDNDSKKLERTFFGLPSKGMGFSRDAPMRFGPPRFGDAAFKVANAATAVVVTLHYY